MIILFIFVGNESGGIVLMVRKCKLNLFINGIKYIYLINVLNVFIEVIVFC